MVKILVTIVTKLQEAMVAHIMAAKEETDVILEAAAVVIQVYNMAIR